MRVILSRQAEVDLESIGDHIAVDNPRRAVSFIRELREHAARLGQNPKAFPVVARRDAVELRRMAYRGYLVLYYVTESTVMIDRIVHGARDVPAILGASD
jgi:plasmid stabilization system protein ParE